MIRPLWSFLPAGVLLWVAACPAAWAQSESAAGGKAANPGISVSGVGTIKGRPDRVRIEVRVQGKAEITDDALVKYRDARRRLIEALDKLKLENLRTNEQAVSIAAAVSQASYQAMMNGMAAQSDGSNPIEVSGSLQVELAELNELSPEDVLKTVGKVLDTIKDAGGSLGPSSSETMMAMRYGRMPNGTSVKFVLRDFKRLREQAYEQAVEDARTRGSRLAKLNGVKLGQVVAVQEVHVAGDQPESNVQRTPWYWGGETTPKHRARARRDFRRHTRRRAGDCAIDRSLRDSRTRRGTSQCCEIGNYLADSKGCHCWLASSDTARPETILNNESFA